MVHEGDVKKKHSVVGMIGFILSIVQLIWGYVGLCLCVVSFILCIIGCMEKDKKCIFPMVGNIICFVSLLLYMCQIYLAYIHYTL